VGDNSKTGKIGVMDWKGKKIAILGWGIDSQDVYPWLMAQGAEITVLDEKKDGKSFGDLSKFDVLVRSPGVYRYRPAITEAEKAGVVVTSKTKIFFDECPAKIIGVTGTKGKGTTSTLIYEMLKRGLPAGRQVFLGGNIGKGIFQNLNLMDEESWVVLELSSFQLVDLHKSPHIAVVLMTTSEHQDWHTSVDEYIDSKSQITKHQIPNDFVVYNKDYPNSVKIGMQGKGQKMAISGSDWMGEMRLRGNHNKENMAAAAAAARILDIRNEIIEKVAREFRGLEHRLEEVATVDEVTYFEDSFSTTPETTIAAIQSFSEPLILICGGSEKGSDFTQMGEVISKAKNIKAVILIGLMTDRIQASIKGKKILRGAKSMTEIMEQVKSVAKPGDVVVLSPAAASFDMFKNYKDRGNQFKAEVRKLQ